MDNRTQSSQKSPRKKKEKIKVPVISPMLKGWVVLITGRGDLSQPQKTLTELIESHSGKVVGSLSSKVTHFLTGEDMDGQTQAEVNKIEAARDLGVIVIDEEYLDWYIRTQQEKLNEKTAVEPPKVSTDNSLKKKKT